MFRLSHSLRLHIGILVADCRTFLVVLLLLPLLLLLDSGTREIEASGTARDFACQAGYSYDIMTRLEGFRLAETNLSTESTKATSRSRLPFPNGYEGRAERHQVPPRQGQKQAHRLAIASRPNRSPVVRFPNTEHLTRIIHEERACPT